jgi:hypothetical protein
MKFTGENRHTGGKTCPSATLSTINPTWTDPESNTGLHGGTQSYITGLNVHYHLKSQILLHVMRYDHFNIIFASTSGS